MANKQVAHIKAKLEGGNVGEVLDIYDETALHSDDIANNLTTNASGKVLDAFQGYLLKSQADASDSNIASLTVRVNNIANLPSGSTTGDAELADIRVGDDSITYANAGTSVRNQIKEVKREISYLVDHTTITPYIGAYTTSLNSQTGFYYYDITDMSNRIRTAPLRVINVSDANTVTLSCTSDYQFRVFYLDRELNLFSISNWVTSESISATKNNGTNAVAFVMLVLRKTSGDDMSTSEFFDAFLVGNGIESFSECITREDYYSKNDFYETIVGNKEITDILVDGGYYNTGGTVASDTVTQNAGWKSGALNVKKGDKFIITGTGGINGRLWCFTDSERNILSVETASVSRRDFEIVAPSDGYLFINVIYSSIEPSLFKTNYWLNIEDFSRIESAVRTNNFSENNYGYSSTNMIWSWWYYPLCISFKRIRDKLYFGYTTNDGYTGIASYDFKTKEVFKNNLKHSDVDDHNALAIHITDNGKIICAYAGGHNSDDKIHIRRSITNESIERFYDDVTIKSSSFTSYAQLFEYDNRLFVFYRSNNNRWCYSYSDDYGETWSQETILVTNNNQYYCMLRKTTTENVLRVLMCSNPDGQNPEIRQAFFHLDTLVLYNSDNTTVLGSSSVSSTSVSVLIPVDSNYGTQRLLDCAVTAISSPLVLYALFTASYNDNSVYRLYDSGNVKTICEGGLALWVPKYQLGCSFINNTTIVSARHNDGNDIVELYNYDGNSFSIVKTVQTESTSGNIRNGRPIGDVNGRAFIWHRGYYNPNEYVDFNTDGMIGTIE